MRDAIRPTVEFKKKKRKKPLDSFRDNDAHLEERIQQFVARVSRWSWHANRLFLPRRKKSVGVLYSFHPFLNRHVINILAYPIARKEEEEEEEEEGTVCVNITKGLKGLWARASCSKSKVVLTETAVAKKGGG